MTVTNYTIPGVYFETPQVRDTRLRGVPVGVAGFVGYADHRPARGPAARQATAPRWPLMLDAPEQIDQLLQFPAWGQLSQALYSYFSNGGTRCFVAGISDEDPHTPVSLLGGGEPGNRFGLLAFDASEEVELIVAPDLFVSPGWRETPSLDESYVAQGCILDFCRGGVGEQRLSQGGYFAILDAPPGLDEQALLAYTRRIKQHPNAEFGALYYPWIDIMHAGDYLHRMPPSPQITGILSELSKPPDGQAPGVVSASQGPHMSSGNKNVWDAIATETELMRNAVQEHMLAGVNCLLAWPGRGIVVWGTRTLSPDKSLNQISVRRVLSYIHRSVYHGTQWAVFEPNDHNLWKQLKSRIEIFLEDLWNKGLLVGAAQEDAFFVKCDEELNPAKDRDEGRVNILLMVRPVRSTEFIVLQVSHTVGAAAGA